MTAYELSEKKISILKRVSYLSGELGTGTETILLTDEEVRDIINTFNECIDIIDDCLKKKG